MEKKPTMLVLAHFVLAAFILIVLDNEPVIAIVLGGLLAFTGILLFKLVTLGNKLTEQEQTLTEQEKSLAWIKSRIRHFDSDEEQQSTEPTSPDDQVTSVARRVEDEVQQPISVDKKVDGWGPDKPVIEPSPVASEPEPKTHRETTTSLAEKSAADSVKQPAAPPRTPARPAEPAGPGFIETTLKGAWNWFTDGNVFVRVGIIILFMGMTFLIRYAIGKNMLPIEVRLAAVSAVAIALLFWGWRQRNKRKTFSLIVQGGGVGLLYLTIFAGFSLYQVIPSGMAFVFLALIVVLAAMLAIFQDAKALALFASIGGFLAPVLTSSGSNNYIGLFSYYAFLNAGIFFVAWFKTWRILNLVGFLFTFAISTTWGVLSYKHEYFSTTEPFLILFFLMYTAIGILFARSRTEFYKDYVDSSLIFGTPLLAFGLQSAMVKDFEYGIAISAFSLAAFYLLLTGMLWKKYGDSLRLLTETFLSLGVIFATLAVPFAIDGTLTGATWAIEGAGILWISVRQEQKYRRLFGAALMFAAGVILAAELILPLSKPQLVFSHAFANSVFIGCVIIAIAASTGSWLMSREYHGKLDIEKSLSDALLVYGLFALFAGFEYQIYDFSLYTVHGALLAVLTSITAVCFIIAGNRQKWGRARWVSLLAIVPFAVAAALSYAYQPQLSEHFGYLVWPLSLVIYFYGLRQALTAIPQKPLIIAHIVAAIVIVSLLFWDGIWQLLLLYSLLAIAFNQIGKSLAWPQLKMLALGFLPVLALCSMAAIAVDGNLIDLSSNAADVTWPFPPGYVLWPFGFVVYFYLLRQNPRIGPFSTSNMHYAGAALIYALLLWLGSWPLLLGASLLSVLCTVLWRHYSWREMHLTSMALLPIMWLITFINILDNSFHPFYLQDYNLNLQTTAELGYILWPLAFTSLFWIYRQYDKRKQAATPVLHSYAIILPVLLVTWEASWHILDYVSFMNAWHLAWLPLMAMLAITLIMRSKFWPFIEHRDGYHRIALPLLAVVPLVWSFIQLTSSANSMPLPWIPLINPVDIIQTVIVIGLLLWFDEILSAIPNPPEKQNVLNGVLVFVFLWMNVDVLRGVHHWADIPWQLPDILSADLSQTVLSLFWALSGLATTLYASRKQRRKLWVFGASLLGVVVFKLLLIDLSARETIERIVSFTGVGLLLLLVGYFSPLPPRNNHDTSET